MRHLIKFYMSLVIVFMVAKLFFMSYNTDPMGKTGISDVFAVLWHGFPLDLATSAYLTAPLLLARLAGLWSAGRVRKMLFRAARPLYVAYVVAVSLLTAVILIADTCLYEYWGIKLDGTVWTYLGQPAGIVSSVSGWMIAGGILVFLLLSAGMAWWLVRLWPRRVCGAEGEDFPLRRRMAYGGVYVLAGGLLFLAMRGGVGRSTANVGMVYFSENIYLNHCAVNPAFSIVSSLMKTKDFARQHDYFAEAERARIFASLHYATSGTTADTLLTTPRPNVLLILMEGCGGVFVHAVDSAADPAVTPHLNRLAAEGVVFTRCYANSFRTDRGTLCTLSGYPAFPDVSVMKVPSKCESLPSIARSLRAEGYATEFLYGGDINFTNTHGYLIATGYERTFGDKDFPAADRRTHGWGVTDRIAFGRLLEMVKSYPADRPWHTGFLTLASHEPWGVPYNRIPGDTIANSMAYLDDCIGRFIGQLRELPQWDNTLVILIPDHGINYPQGISDADPRKSHIPMIWTGGAVRRHRIVTTLMNQTDLCATLLGQMGLDHSAFRFSRDVLADTYDRPSAVHVWSEGIVWMDPRGYTAINLLTRPQSLLRSVPSPSPERQAAANAFLQTCYDDLGSEK